MNLSDVALYHKMEAFLKRLADVSDELGVLFIVDKGYLVDLENQCCTSISLMPRGNPNREAEKAKP